MIKTVCRGGLAALSLMLACTGDKSSKPAVVQSPPIHVGPAESSSVASSTVVRRDSVTRTIVHVPTPDTLRGLYVNRWAALGSKLRQLIDVARKTEINALVIDVKDDRGFVLYRSSVPLARQIGADTADGHWMSDSKVRAMIDTLIANGIYPIARIVVAKDPLLASNKLELAIKRKSDLQPWLDKNGRPWLDPHQPAVWQYAADLAREAYDLGFSEVQFDYVRFPDEKRLVSETVYPLAKGRVRAQVIRDQLGFVRRNLGARGIPVTADVFGLTATDTTDMGIGQRWEMFIDQVDVVLPMVYPSHFARGTYKLRNPNAHPYETIAHALKDAKARSAPIAKAARIIPWYQDFTLGAPHYYAEHVRAQKKAGYDNGFQSWILWNPKSNYTVAALEPRP
ncbi:MAG TPA: putative glycoside hydrolase [Gemmatimonadaceae bacterium]